jgi:hypothetical protein
MLVVKTTKNAYFTELWPSANERLIAKSTLTFFYTLHMYDVHCTINVHVYSTLQNVYMHCVNCTTCGL